MLNSKQKGNLTELQCISSFCELGYSVSIPYGDCERYDFIVDVGGKLIKVQVKTSRVLGDGDAIKFSCRSTRINSNGTYNRGYTSEEIDYFATFYNKKCYLIPIKECSSEKILRFKVPKNKQKEGICYAKDYELSSQIDKIAS